MDKIYEVIIHTNYMNVIKFQTDSIDDAVKEILEQPWVVDYEIKEVEHSDYKVLIKNF